jgi:hypothetical protein
LRTEPREGALRHQGKGGTEELRQHKRKEEAGQVHDDQVSRKERNVAVDHSSVHCLRQQIRHSKLLEFDQDQMRDENKKGSQMKRDKKGVLCPETQLVKHPVLKS